MGSTRKKQVTAVTLPLHTEGHIIRAHVKDSMCVWCLKSNYMPHERSDKLREKGKGVVYWLWELIGIRAVTQACDVESLRGVAVAFYQSVMLICRDVTHLALPRDCVCRLWCGGKCINTCMKLRDRLNMPHLKVKAPPHDWSRLNEQVSSLQCLLPDLFPT